MDKQDVAPHTVHTLRPGQAIEILSHYHFGQAVWEPYRIVDWETPRQDAEGRWLFTAVGLDFPLGPSPMMVPPARIRYPTNRS